MLLRPRTLSLLARHLYQPQIRRTMSSSTSTSSSTMPPALKPIYFSSFEVTSQVNLPFEFLFFKSLPFIASHSPRTPLTTSLLHISSHLTLILILIPIPKFKISHISPHLSGLLHNLTQLRSCEHKTHPPRSRLSRPLPARSPPDGPHPGRAPGPLLLSAESTDDARPAIFRARILILTISS